MEADFPRRPEPITLSSFGTTFRPSKAPRPDQLVDAKTAKKAIEKLTTNIGGLVVEGDIDNFCTISTESKLTKEIPRS